MERFFIPSLSLTLALTLAACVTDATGPSDDGPDLSSHDDALIARRGGVLRVTPLRDFDADEVRTTLTELGFDSSAVAHDVSLRRVVYSTPDAHGRSSEASALLAVPDVHRERLPLVSYAHGAIVFRGDAPSVSEDPLMRAPALTYASAGFVAVMPDYLGLGEGPGTHPFNHVPSEASASLDALRAVRSLLAREGTSVEPDVYVTGFSQGGTAAFALAHALERDRELGLAALAPIAGAHEWSRWVREALDGAVAAKFAAVVVGYQSVTWDRLLPLYAAPSDFFLAPFDATIESLFDSYHRTDEVLGGTPDAPERLFTPDALAQLKAPRGALARALRETDRACRAVDAPTLLLAARGDQSVPFSHSEHCLAKLQRQGGDVELLDLGAVDHDPSNLSGTREALRFFRSLR